MGGNFGTRNAFYPEYALLPWRRRPGDRKRWTASRLECFMSDYQARPLVRAELVLDASGCPGLRGVNTQNPGAQTVYFVAAHGLDDESVYAIPAVHFEGHAVLIAHRADRGVPRWPPEAVFVIERLIEA